MTPSTDTTADYYRLLGISPDSTLEEIKAAYRSKVRLSHPDLVAGRTEDARQAATEMTARLNEAYECLRDLDRRAAYDTSRRADTVSAGRPSTGLLVVSPRTLRCDVTPGDIVHVTLNVRADHPPGGDGLQGGTSDRSVAASFTVTNLTAKSAKLEVRMDTSMLDVHRIVQIPIVVTWGKLTGTATVVVRTTELGQADSNPPSREKQSTSPSRGHRRRRPGRRVRDLATISLGGIALPLFALTWASGLLAVPAPANPPLVAAFSAAVVAATAWLLTSSRLMRRPDRLTRVGVIWGHLMRWSGWALVGSCAVVLGIPAVALILMAVFFAPILGLVVTAIIVSLFDSRVR